MALAAVLSIGTAQADGLLTDIGAFDQADAASFYQFDACGDGLSGTAFRKALREKFAHCPFDPAARATFARRMQLQQSQSSEKLAQLIDQHSGLPVQLEGMAQTCHEQRGSPEYLRVQAMLVQYGKGEASAESVLPGSCNAGEITPP